jgi:hypothetical protein
MKKINTDAIMRIAEEISILGNESTIKDVMDTIVVDDRIAIIKLDGIDYEIWKTDKKDEFDVIKIVFANSKEDDFHKKMSKQQVLENIILKAFE